MTSLEQFRLGTDCDRDHCASCGRTIKSKDISVADLLFSLLQRCFPCVELKECILRLRSFSIPTVEREESGLFNGLPPMDGDGFRYG